MRPRASRPRDGGRAASVHLEPTRPSPPKSPTSYAVLIPLIFSQLTNSRSPDAAAGRDRDADHLGRLILSAGPEVIVGAVVTGILSIASWFIIGMKWWQFRRIRSQSKRFFNEVEREPGLREAYRKVMKLPPSPFSRLFREGINFYSELKPGAMTRGRAHAAHPHGRPSSKRSRWCSARKSPPSATSPSLYVPWLATIGVVSAAARPARHGPRRHERLSSASRRRVRAISPRWHPASPTALVTTVAGLAVAIPAVMGYNLFASRVGRYEGELEGFGNALVGWMAREGLL